MKSSLEIPKENLSLEETERLKRAKEIHIYRKRQGLSNAYRVEEIFKFIGEWDEARMKIKRANGW